MILHLDIKGLLDELMYNEKTSDKRIKELLSLLDEDQKSLLREYSVNTLSDLTSVVRKSELTLATTMKHIDENRDVYYYLKAKQMRGLICFNKYKFLDSEEIRFISNYKQACKLISDVTKVVERKLKRIKYLNRLLNFM